MYDVTYIIQPDAVTPLPLTPPSGQFKAVQFVLESGDGITPNTGSWLSKQDKAGVPGSMNETNSQVVPIGGVLLFPKVSDNADPQFDLTSYYVKSVSGSQKVKVTATFPDGRV